MENILKKIYNTNRAVEFYSKYKQIQKPEATILNILKPVLSVSFDSNQRRSGDTREMPGSAQSWIGKTGQAAGMIEADCNAPGKTGGKGYHALWAAAPADLALSTEDVHIWRAGLDPGIETIRKAWETLSPDEMMRTGRFRFERDAGRFIAARGTLRLILARYLEVPPGSIRFCYEDGGKPRLDDAFCKTGLQFNLSHSEGLALFAVTRGRSVGVDIECVREVDEMESIVGQFFSERKRALFGKLPEDEKREKFFEWWTRAEALSKAIGDGLASDIDWPDARLADGDWTTLSISLAAGFAGAVIVEGQGVDIRCWQCPGRLWRPENPKAGGRS